MILQVGVKAFLKNPEGKFLLIQRSPDKYPNAKGNWDIVGGRIEAGTPLIENLKREIQEETHLAMLSTPRLIAAQDIIPATDRHIVRLTYTAETAGEPVLDTTENVAYRWFTLAELKQHPDLDIYVKEILDQGLID